MGERAVDTVRRVLRLIDGTEGNMKINRLQVLLEVYSAGKISLSEVYNRLDIHPAHVSKLVASWTNLTADKKPGPNYIKAYPDPMHMNTKIAEITPEGKKYLDTLLDWEKER